MHHVRDLGIGSQVPLPEYVYPPIPDAAATVDFSHSGVVSLARRFSAFCFALIPWFLWNQNWHLNNEN